MSNENKRGAPGAAMSNTPGEQQRANMVLMKVTGTAETPSLASAAKQLDVAVAYIDSEYGVVAVDREKGVYAVRVRRDRVSGKAFDPQKGPYSDPQISGFGLPRKGEDG